MAAPEPAELVDGFGRVHRDLRISVTDRCNFRCSYCMPAEGMDWLPREDLLSYEELTRIARVCVERFGFDGIRLTGGEPTVRAHLPVLIEKLSALGADLALTTNGATLRLVAHDLAAAGLRRINISIDSLRADRFAEITKRDELARVLDGIDAALEAGLDPVKLNVVVMRGVNDDELVDFAAFGRDQGRPGALHRVHAPRRPAGLDQRAGRHPGRDRGPHRRGLPARGGARVGPRLRPRSSVAVPRRRR